VVMHALEKSPKKRPANVVEWAAELEAAVRAVTEREFQGIFLTASDEDLEAALLLTGEPGKLREKSVSKDITGELAEDLVQVTSPARDITGPITSPLVQSTISLSDTLTEEALGLNDSGAYGRARDTAPIGKLTPETDSTEDIADLQDRLLLLAKETSGLLQIIINDLSARNPIDQVFFIELDNAMESLRTTMTQLQGTKIK
jgi:hypothetical protein